MNEFDDLLNLMGGSKETPAPTPTEPVPPIQDPTPPAEGDPAPTPDPEPEVDPEPPVSTPEPTVPAEPAAPAEPPKEDKAARAFAEMRVENTKLTRILQAAADAKGMSLQDYTKQLEDEALAKRAADTKTSPEVLQRLEQLEEEKRYRDTEEVRTFLKNQYDSIRTSIKGVSEDDLKAFTAALVQREHDFSNTKVNYLEIYRGMHYETLRERERQEALAARRTGGTSNPITQNGRGVTPPSNEINSMAALESMLDTMPK